MIAAQCLANSVPDRGGEALGKFLSAHPTIATLSLEDSGLELTAWNSLLKNLNLPNLRTFRAYQTEVESLDQDNSELDRTNALAFGSFFRRHPQLVVVKLQIPTDPIKAFSEEAVLPNMTSFCGHLFEIIALLEHPRSRLCEIDVDDFPNDFDATCKPLSRPGTIKLESLACDVDFFNVSQSFGGRVLLYQLTFFLVEKDEQMDGARLFEVQFSRICVDFVHDNENNQDTTEFRLEVVRNFSLQIGSSLSNLVFVVQFLNRIRARHLL